MILAGSDGFFRTCSRHHVRPSYGDYPHLPDQSNITTSLGNFVNIKLLTGTADEGRAGRATALTFFLLG